MKNSHEFNCPLLLLEKTYGVKIFIIWHVIDLILRMLYFHIEKV